MNELMKLIEMSAMEPQGRYSNLILTGDDLALLAMDNLGIPDDEDTLQVYGKKALVSEYNPTTTFKMLKDEYPELVQFASVKGYSKLEEILAIFYFTNISLFEKQDTPQEIVIEAVPEKVLAEPVQEAGRSEDTVSGKLDKIISMLEERLDTPVQQSIPNTVYAHPKLAMAKETYQLLIQEQLDKCESEEAYYEFLLKFMNVFVSSIGNVPDTKSVYDYIVTELAEV